MRIYNSTRRREIYDWRRYRWLHYEGTWV